MRKYLTRKEKLIEISNKGGSKMHIDVVAGLFLGLGIALLVIYALIAVALLIHKATSKQSRHEKPTSGLEDWFLRWGNWILIACTALLIAGILSLAK